MLCSAPFYLVVGLLAARRLKERPALRMLGLAAANGLLGYWIASWLDFQGLLRIDAQLGRLILFTYPFFVVFLGAAFFGHPFRRSVIPAFVLAYAGLLLVFGGKLGESGGTWQMAAGAALTLASAMAFAMFNLFGAGLIAPLGAAVYTSVAMLAASAGVIGHFMMVEPVAILARQPGDVLAYAGLLAIVATVIPSYLLSIALVRVGAEGASISGNIGPIATMLLAAALLGESIGATEIAGGALVIGAMTLFARAK